MAKPRRRHLIKAQEIMDSLDRAEHRPVSASEVYAGIAARIREDASRTGQHLESLLTIDNPPQPG